MLEELTYDGIDLVDRFGVYASTARIYDRSSRAVGRMNVAGKNGSIILDYGFDEDVTIDYPCAMISDFRESFYDLTSMLAQHFTNYKVLKDSEQPNVFRLASYAGISRIKEYTDKATFTLSFICKPQLFLEIGNTEVSVNSGDMLVNPTREDAKPIIKISGTGTVTVGSTTITISDSLPSAITTVVVDSEAQEVYAENDPMVISEYVSLTNYEYPVLTGATRTGVTFSNGITSVKVIPRWFTR